MASTPPRTTSLHAKHLELGARMVEFGGWSMPVMYPTGMVEEHLATRRGAGLFDVSHMGRFVVRGDDALPFLQRALTNNAAGLDVDEVGAQYTMIADAGGGALDDAYLYRFVPDEYLLVVNAANRARDWQHLQGLRREFRSVALEDRTDDLAMLSLQGPRSRDIVAKLADLGRLPEPQRNRVGITVLDKAQVWLARTGYSGEPVGFEMFLRADLAPSLWDVLLAEGATAVGLGARDTLRLEAGLPLYGHELGTDPEGRQIPIFACPLGPVAVSFSEVKGDFAGRRALEVQQRAHAEIVARDYTHIRDLPRRIQPVAVLDRGVARAGAPVFRNGTAVGWVTSGTSVPYWEIEGEGLESRFTGERGRRSICLACLDSDVVEDDSLTIEVRGKRLAAVVVPYHLRGEAPPWARPILATHRPAQSEPAADPLPARARRLVDDALANTRWRQRQCMNLIPSEMTHSPVARLLSVMDPSFRYAEHRQTEAFYDADVFYYQGTGFIAEVERLLAAELCAYLGAREAETRVVSGQMANTTVFSGLVDYLNRADRKAEPRRLRSVLNHHIGRGGHLSAQPMGALGDFVARDPATDRPAVVNFPALPDDPFRIDLAETHDRIERHRPELIVLGRSVILHPEPVAELRHMLDGQPYRCVLMYDMAHVLGLVGPHFQQPFAEGAELVTGSTHKTFFGTQRGVVAGIAEEHEERYELWEAVRRRTFPGAVSNHHLGTLVGLLLAAYEMNHFKDAYQGQVIANAKAFARALAERGLEVAGDPAVDFTETHQVLVKVGYARGPELAARLEDSGILCNYQAGPGDEGFSAASYLRLGVAEMTRFGMDGRDFQQLAQLFGDVVLEDRQVAPEVARLRGGFLTLGYCFSGPEWEDRIQGLHGLI